MGVSGFVPFIQKAYPHIVHTLPSRLKDFTGKKFVIDGTLITQRLHYGPSPYPYKHVLGWYNLAKEMKDFGVTALCIFDGDSRSEAKADELGRRREVRKLANFRGTLELSRTKRLSKLKSTISGFETLDEEGRKSVAELLQKLNPGMDGVGMDGVGMDGVGTDGVGMVGMTEGLNKVGARLEVLKEAPIVKEEEEADGSIIDDEGIVKSDVVPIEAQPQDMTPLINEKDIDQLTADGGMLKDHDVPPVQIRSQDTTPLVNEKEIGQRTADGGMLKDHDVPPVQIRSQDTTPLVNEKEIGQLTADGEMLEDRDVSPVQIRSQDKTPLVNEKEIGQLTADGEMLEDRDVSPVQIRSQDKTPLVTEKEIRQSTTINESVEEEDVVAVENASMPSVIVKEIRQLTIDDEIIVQPQDTKNFLATVPELEGKEVEKPSVEVIKSCLLDSYRDFKTSITKVTSTPVPSPTTPLMDEQTQEDLILSKTQHELTLEEGKVWNELTQATTCSVHPTQDVLDHFVLNSAEDRLQALTTRSATVSDSYQRRMHAPTKDTYIESREILEAMGIPCYVVEGSCEGEALASSLVHQGLADYVVTEDSDVLAYEAPMIRNITSRHPLTLIHGADVRAELKLSHEEYVDLIILFGTDFSQRIKNVGPSRAYKFIQEHGSIEKVVEQESKYSPRIPRAEYLAQVKAARAIFNNLPPIPDRLKVTYAEEDPVKVSVIMERCGFGKVLMLNENWDCGAALSGNYFSDDPILERM